MEHNKNKNTTFKRTVLAVAMTSAVAMITTLSYAQDGVTDSNTKGSVQKMDGVSVDEIANTGTLAIKSDKDTLTEVVVTGLRGSLLKATEIKRNAHSFVDAVVAIEMGKFPDLNVAESLQRVSGISIDRSGGVGQQVTVRGLGPQFNTVLVNGRQIANDSGGREFNFDVLAAEQITTASVYKSGRADLQEGGIGATIVLDTAKPMDKPGFYASISSKAINETNETLGATTPAISGIISNTFKDDRIGALFSFAYQQRNTQINRIETDGWIPDETISNNAGNNNIQMLYEDVYFPSNWNQGIDDQDRTRLNANLVLQIAPLENLTVTFDGSYNRLEVDSVATYLGSSFEPDRAKTATIDVATRTVTRFSQDVGSSVTSGDPTTDFISHTRNGRNVTNISAGVNIDVKLSDNLVGIFDLATSRAKNDRAGKDRFNVIGITNTYTFDATGDIPTVMHNGFTNGETLPADLLRLGFNEKGSSPTDEDSVTEVRTDFIYSPESEEIKSTAKFGTYFQRRKKSQFQIKGTQTEYSDYKTVAPVADLNVVTFRANNFFP